MNPPATTQREQMGRHLARLAENLTSNGLLAEVMGDIQKPYLKVALVDTPNQDERVLCQQDEGGLWWFWWPWGRAIGAVGDHELVMSRIVLVLRSVEADG